MSPDALKLCLYVAGSSRHSEAAQANLHALLGEPGTPVAEIEIIDVFESPQRAMADGILLTPTLVRLSPLPARTIVGDLHDRQLVRHTLGLRDQ